MRSRTHTPGPRAPLRRPWAGRPCPSSGPQARRRPPQQRRASRPSDQQRPRPPPPPLLPPPRPPLRRRPPLRQPRRLLPHPPHPGAATHVTPAPGRDTQYARIHRDARQLLHTTCHCVGGTEERLPDAATSHAPGSQERAPRRARRQSARPGPPCGRPAGGRARAARP